MVQFRGILAALALTALAGCTSDFGPWPMPTGYTYHTAEYKAPPGPEPVFKKWEMEQRKKKTQESEMVPSMDTHFDDPASAAQVLPTETTYTGNDPQLWLDAANDLSARLFGKFGNPTEAVYLSPPGAGEEDQFFAAALRAALQERNIAVAMQPGMGPFTLRYVAAGTGGGDGRMLLTITMQSGPQTLAEESGIYTVGSGANNAAAIPVENAPMPLTAPDGNGF